MEHLDWSARMRIIMGTAYCLQHMHEMNPPMAHSDFNSSEIYLTDDYAAKVCSHQNSETVLESAFIELHLPKNLLNCITRFCFIAEFAQEPLKVFSFLKMLFAKRFVSNEFSGLGDSIQLRGEITSEETSEW